MTDNKNIVVEFHIEQSYQIEIPKDELSAFEQRLENNRLNEKDLSGKQTFYAWFIFPNK